jgi:hypothetical protein
MTIQHTNTLPAYTKAVYVDGMVANKDAGLIWGRKDDVAPPAIGSAVTVTINQLGTGTVIGYFTQEGYLGLVVQLVAPPAWFLKQNNNRNPACHVFGPEFKI